MVTPTGAAGAAPRRAARMPGPPRCPQQIHSQVRVRGVGPDPPDEGDRKQWVARGTRAARPGPEQARVVSWGWQRASGVLSPRGLGRAVDQPPHEPNTTTVTRPGRRGPGPDSAALAVRVSQQLDLNQKRAAVYLGTELHG